MPKTISLLLTIKSIQPGSLNVNEIEPISGETLALDGKVLRGSYLLETDNPHSQPHKAITLVSPKGFLKDISEGVSFREPSDNRFAYGE